MIYVLIVLLIILSLFLWILMGNKILKIIISAVLGSLVVLGGWTWWHNRPAKPKTNIVVNTPTAAPAMNAAEDVIHVTTPITLDFDFEVNIESNKPVRIKLPGVDQPVDWIPSKGFTQFPTPGMGPRTFWDPSDSAQGRVDFILKRVRR